jgi:hypothetical protein
LSGVEGIVIGWKHRLRLVLSITLLQRSVLLEIDRDQVSAEEVPDWAGRSKWISPVATPFDVVQGD